MSATERWYRDCPTTYLEEHLEKIRQERANTEHRLNALEVVEQAIMAAIERNKHGLPE